MLTMDGGIYAWGSANINIEGRESDQAGEQGRPDIAGGRIGDNKASNYGGASTAEWHLSISPAAKYPAIQPPMPVQAGAVVGLLCHGPA